MNLLSILLAAQVATSTAVIPRAQFDLLAREAIEAQRIASVYRSKLATCENVIEIERENAALVAPVQQQIASLEASEESSGSFEPLLLGLLVGGGIGIGVGALAGVWIGIQATR